MEYVEGESLTQVVQRAGAAGLLDWRPALRVGVHLARALEYAHGRQILHRNVAPMNVLLSRRGRVAKLGDLMLAKALEGELAVDLTEPGELLGDVNYLAPERTFPSRHDRRALRPVQPRGDAVRAADGPAAVRGRLDDRDDQEPPGRRRWSGRRRFRQSLPDSVEQVVLRLLARRPEDRYPSAAELLRDLERLAAEQRRRDGLTPLAGRQEQIGLPSCLTARSF